MRQSPVDLERRLAFVRSLTQAAPPLLGALPLGVPGTAPPAPLALALLLPSAQLVHEASPLTMDEAELRLASSAAAAAGMGTSPCGRDGHGEVG